MSTRPAARDPSERSANTTTSTALRLGRLLYGGVLALMAADGLRNAEERAQYADSKGVPMPALSNTVAHYTLLFGGLGVSLWRLPRLATAAIAAFFLGVTPMMHDFWSVADPDERQQQQIQFLKNTALFGTALVLLGVASAE
ncbi:DoxX family protein [Haloarcula sp. S1CR25-12]|uniref:DoxX family protein n=1 Tax=Haloarcula saliterrae TaxID=2950534 RepID=A0ABU2FDP2_9EURY|nr:DoxX family protein [Haloarcula sp. S1CR25-12]MDS0259835.1 DoxX family protein [Haloarcula sp. S1CR25-12]